MSKNKKVIAPELRLKYLSISSFFRFPEKTESTKESAPELVYGATADISNMEGDVQVSLKLTDEEIEAIQKIAKEAVKRAYNDIGVL